MNPISIASSSKRGAIGEGENSVYSTSAFPSRPTRGTAAVAAGAIMACASEVLSSRSRLKPLSGARLREEVIRRLEQQSGQSFLSA